MRKYDKLKSIKNDLVCLIVVGGIGPLNNFGSSSFQSMGIGQGVGNLAANGQGMAGGASLGPFGGFALGTGAGFGLG